MKKINLNLMKEHLTRDEMRAISGGSGWGNGVCYCTNTGETHYNVNCESNQCPHYCEYGPWICSGPGS